MEEVPCREREPQIIPNFASTTCINKNNVEVKDHERPVLAGIEVHERPLVHPPPPHSMKQVGTGTIASICGSKI